MTRFRVAGVVPLVRLGAGLLIRRADHAGVSPKNPAHSAVEIPTIEGQAVIETVDLRNGNLHVEIPIRAVHQKTAGPRSGH